MSTEGTPIAYQVLGFVFMNSFMPSVIVFAISWLLMLFTGRELIAWLKRLKGMKWSPREDTPDSHLAKSGTPSMGGIGIIGVALLAYLAFGTFLAFTRGRTPGASAPAALEVYEMLAAGLTFPICVGLHCVLGLVDDWSKARGKGGLLARQKLAGQVFLAVAIVGAGYLFTSSPWAIGRSIAEWSFGETLRGLPPHLLFAGLFVAVLVIIGTSNAVNLTDGIDGLAAGLSVQCGLVYVLLGALTPQGFPLHDDVTWMWAAIAGSCLGFLAFNKNPAKVFMGDTGSLALGAALGAGAVLTGTVFLLPFVGFIFFVEMFSVIFQVAYFKFTKKKYGEGRRIFRRAPLHHHYELGGWSEWRVVITFWAVNLVTTTIGLILWFGGYLPRFP